MGHKKKQQNNYQENQILEASILLILMGFYYTLVAEIFTRVSRCEGMLWTSKSSFVTNDCIWYPCLFFFFFPLLCSIPFVICPSECDIVLNYSIYLEYYSSSFIQGLHSSFFISSYPRAKMGNVNKSSCGGFKCPKIVSFFKKNYLNCVSKE